MPQSALPRELFTLYRRHAELLLVVGTTGATFGTALTALAVWMAFGSPWPGPLARLFGSVMFFYAALIITPSIHLLRYRLAILAADEAPSSLALTDMLDQQHRFWRFVGWASIAVLAILFLALAAQLGSRR
ncbi:MAG TPA: hypothetical protein VE010_08695 [Thermoanaerobaculia bacterium]|nr:hypothetical protein [Thermoanaerobaculia bacterium]